MRRHPWLFSGAIAPFDAAEPASGETVDVISSKGEWLARGAYSPRSSIRVRLWTWAEDEVVDRAFIQRRLTASIRRRGELARDPGTNAYREVYAESDGLPGLIVDRYATFRVLQLLSAGAERWREEIVAALASEGDCEGIFERSDAEVRGLEGLEPRRGPVWGRAPNAPVEILENGLSYLVDIVGGQKTGFYLDQRRNRAALLKTAAGGELLDCFSYTGGFTLAALRSGASKVTLIEESLAALELARRNLQRNGFNPEACEWIQGDAFGELRRLRDRNARFDVVILDPPKFAPTAAQVQAASRGYKDINLLALKMLRPGGKLFTFSCSGAIGPELFQSIVAGAVLDSGVDAAFTRWLGQAPDHPVGAAFPEALYLKGLVCSVR